MRCAATRAVPGRSHAGHGNGALRRCGTTEVIEDAVDHLGLGDVPRGGLERAAGQVFNVPFVRQSLRKLEVPPLRGFPRRPSSGSNRR